MHLKKQVAIVLTAVSLGVTSVPTVQAACYPSFLDSLFFWRDKTVADVDDTDAIRAKVRITDPAEATVAAGRVDIPGIKWKFYKGLSSAQRKRAKTAVGWRVWYFSSDYANLLKTNDVNFGVSRPIKSPYGDNIQFINHAEERILNQVFNDTKGMSADKLKGTTLSIHVSNIKGVCGHCLVGVKGATGSTSGYEGIFYQFTRDRPNITVA